jgi:hypothetical protein
MTEELNWLKIFIFKRSPHLYLSLVSVLTCFYHRRLIVPVSLGKREMLTKINTADKTFHRMAVLSQSLPEMIQSTRMDFRLNLMV